MALHATELRDCWALENNQKHMCFRAWCLKNARKQSETRVFSSLVPQERSKTLKNTFVFELAASRTIENTQTHVCFRAWCLKNTRIHSKTRVFSSLVPQERLKTFENACVFELSRAREPLGRAREPLGRSKTLKNMSVLECSGAFWSALGRSGMLSGAGRSGPLETIRQREFEVTVQDHCSRYGLCFA